MKDFGGFAMRTNYLIAALPLTCLFAANAFAQGACTKPLALRNEVQMTSTNGGPSAIPVKINGTDQKLTLATAGTTTQLSPSGLKALNLDPKRSDNVIDVPLSDPRRMDEVTIADFSLGTMHGTNIKWMTPYTSGRGGGGGRGGEDEAGGPRPVGTFSLNYMLLYDMDVDFGSDKLRFFSQDHCPGAVMYWQAPGAVGVVPLSIDVGRVVVPVTVNGKAINAVIDTASPFSTVRAAIATRVLGAELGGPKAPVKPGGFGGTNYSWTVDSVAFNALKLDNIPVTVMPDINAGAGDHGDGAKVALASSGLKAELSKPEIVLGMDALRKLHMFFSFAEKRLYVTGTTSTLPAASTAAAPAAAAAP